VDSDSAISAKKTYSDPYHMLILNILYPSIDGKETHHFYNDLKSQNALHLNLTNDGTKKEILSVLVSLILFLSV
jgi:hypothetical protein